MLVRSLINKLAEADFVLKDSKGRTVLDIAYEKRSEGDDSGIYDTLYEKAMALGLKISDILNPENIENE